MAVHPWSENGEFIPRAVHPRDVSRLFLQFTPILIFLVALAMGTFLIGMSGSINMSKINVSTNLPVVQPTQPVNQPAELPGVALVNSDLVENGIAPLFSKEIQLWEPEIVQWAGEWDLDPNMVATVMQIESCGNPEAQSSAGASGLFQVMPFHFDPGENHFNPQINALRGLEYLAKSLKSHQGDISLSFAGYNGGISGSKRPVTAWANETVRYVYWAVGIYEDARTGKSSSERLQEWMDAGGRSLCRKASLALGLSD
jgi:hypothetical protein